LLYFDISNLESTDIIKKTTIKLMTRKVYASNAGYEDGSIIEAYEINDN